MAELTDAEVFGGVAERTDEEVFGDAPPAPGPTPAHQAAREFAGPGAVVTQDGRVLGGSSTPPSLGALFMADATKPFVELPRPTVEADDTGLTRFGKGLGQAGVGVVEGLESPLGVAVLAASALPVVGRAVGRTAAAGFGASAVLEGFKEAAQAWQAGDMEQAGRAVGNLLLGSAMVRGSVTGLPNAPRTTAALEQAKAAADSTPLKLDPELPTMALPEPGVETTSPPPLPATPPPLPAPTTRPIMEAGREVGREVLEPLPPAADPVTAPARIEVETSLWRRLVDKHFDYKPPAEVYASTTPVEPSVLEVLAESILSSKPARRETEALRTQERAQRATRQAGIQGGAPGRAGIGQLKGALAGELPRIDLEPFADRLTATQQDALYNHIYGHELLREDVYRRSNLAIALQDLMEHGHLPQPSQVAWFERIFGPKVASAMLGKQRVASRSLRLLAELANIPRAAITSFDLSASLRQGFTLGVSHPSQVPGAMAAQLKAFGNRDYALALDKSFRVGDQARVRDRSGLDLPSVEGLSNPLREENFQSRLVQHLQNLQPRSGLAKLVYHPIYAYARGLAGSERAYVTYLNWLRTRTFDAVDTTLRESGIPDDVLALKQHQLAMLINSATGRGNIPSHALLNAFFFSPRFTVSRFEHPMRSAKLAATDRSAVGNEALRQLVAQAGAWTALYTMMHLGATAFDWDAQFGYDPNSPDFLKVRLNDNTTIDTGAGYGQAIRLVSQFMSGESVDSVTERTRPADRPSLVGRFLRYKLAPVPSAVWSVVEGKDAVGAEVTPGSLAADLFAPISGQNALDILEEYGASGLPLMLPDVLGANVSIYEPRERR